MSLYPVHLACIVLCLQVVGKCPLIFDKYPTGLFDSSIFDVTLSPAVKFYHENDVSSSGDRLVSPLYMEHDLGLDIGLSSIKGAPAGKVVRCAFVCALACVSVCVRLRFCLWLCVSLYMLSDLHLVCPHHTPISRLTVSFSLCRNHTTPASFLGTCQFFHQCWLAN